MIAIQKSNGSSVTLGGKTGLFGESTKIHDVVNIIGVIEAQCVANFMHGSGGHFAIFDKGTGGKWVSGAQIDDSFA